MSKDLIKDLELEIRKFNLYLTDINKFNITYNNYLDLNKETIIELFKILDIEKYKNVKYVKKKVLPSISIEQLSAYFNDKSMIDLLVVDVNIEKTIENIKMKQGYNDKIANGILNLLLEAKEYEIEDLELMK